MLAAIATIWILRLTKTNISNNISKTKTRNELSFDWEGTAHEYYGMHRKFLSPERIATGSGTTGKMDHGSRFDGQN